MRKKTLIIIGVTIVCIIVVLYGVSEIIMLQGVANMEQNNTRQNADRLFDTLLHEFSNLNATAFDWAAWDDTYAFIQSNSTEYIESNLVDETFIILRLNFMLFFNASGQLVFGKGLNLLNQTETPVSQSLLEHLTESNVLLYHENAKSSITGMLLLSEGPHLMASRPILTSKGEGPIRGTLIIGRLLDSLELGRLSEITHLPLLMQVLGKPPLSPDFQTANSSLSKEEPIFLQPLTSNTIAGYVLFEDVYGKPILIMRFDLSRDFYAQGQASVIYVIFALATVGVIFGGVTMLLLEKFVLSRLSRFSEDVKKIGKGGDLAARVSVIGKDELSGLADEINKMLSALRESETNLHRITENMFDIVSFIDVSGIYKYVSPSVKRTLGYEPNYLVGKSIFDFFHPDDLNRVMEAIQTTIITRTAEKMEYRHRHADGYYLWLEGASNLIFNDKKEIVGAVVSSHDITERKKAEAALRESQQKFERLFRSNPEAAVFVDANDHVLDINPRFSGLFGYLLEEALEKALDDLIVPEDKREEAEILTQKSMVGYIYQETVRKRKDGSLIPVLMSAAPIIIEDQFVGCVVLYGDITERKKMEETIRESEGRLRLLIEYAPDAIYTNDLDGNFLDGNKQAEELTGYKREELKGKNMLEIGLLPEKYLSKATEALEKNLRGEKTGPDEFELIRKDGNTIIVEISTFPIKRGGKVEVMGIARNITERKEMEEKLRESRERLRNLYESVPDALAVYVGREGHLLDHNKAFNKWSGYADEELKDKTFLDFVHHDDHAIVLERYRTKYSEEELPLVYEIKGINKKGEILPTEISVGTYKKEGRVIGIEVVHRDIAERKKMEEALRQSEKQYKTLFESASDSLILLDDSGRIIDVNEKAVEVFGGSKEELLQTHFAETNIFSPEDLQKLLDTFTRILEGKPGYTNIAIKNKKGQERHLECSSSIMKTGDKIDGILVIARDVTERTQMQKKLEEYSQQLETLVEKRTVQLKEAQEQLIKSERLAAIGQVSAMVGHDLRNPLTGINSATYYLKTKLSPKMDKKTREMLELIEKDVQYSNKIITDLMEYSREIRLELTETTPQAIMKEALSLIEILKNVQVLDLTQNEPKIMMDIEKMKRVFSNLIKNAVEAMSEGGKLTISSKESDGNVEFTFLDTGIGMAKEVMEKIWTPFFTTKARGMGLGLAICKRIIEAHGGRISVESIVGEGTTFRLIIPLEPKPKEEGGEKVWVNVPESLLSTMMKASEKF